MKRIRLVFICILFSCTLYSPPPKPGKCAGSTACLILGTNYNTEPFDINNSLPSCILAISNCRNGDDGR